MLDVREAVRSIDVKIEAARSACEALSHLSSPSSAATALEQARGLLFEAAASGSGSGGDRTDERDALTEASERTHHLLNAVEDALSECARSIEDGNGGLLAELEKTRNSVSISVEDIDAAIADWNAISRKHGISPFDLPSCHESLVSLEPYP